MSINVVQPTYLPPRVCIVHEPYYILINIFYLAPMGPLVTYLEECMNEVLAASILLAKDIDELNGLLFHEKERY